MKQRFDHFAVERLPLFEQFRELIRFFGGAIGRFAYIAGEMVELPGSFLTASRIPQEFPVARTYRAAVSDSPEERFVRTSRFFTRQIREQIDAVERPFDRGLDSGPRDRGRT